jgi:hypothetical protein
LYFVFDGVVTIDVSAHGVVTNKMDEAGSCPTVDMSTTMCTAQTSSVVGDNANNCNKSFA